MKCARKLPPAPTPAPAVELLKAPDLPPASVADSCEVYMPPVRRLGSELITAAIDSARCGEHDRLVALTNAYVALIAADGRARA